MLQCVTSPILISRSPNTERCARKVFTRQTSQSSSSGRCSSLATPKSTSLPSHVHKTISLTLAARDSSADCGGMETPKEALEFERSQEVSREGSGIRGSVKAAQLERNKTEREGERRFEKNKSEESGRSSVVCYFRM